MALATCVFHMVSHVQGVVQLRAWSCMSVGPGGGTSLSSPSVSWLVQVTSGARGTSGGATSLLSHGGIPGPLFWTQGGLHTGRGPEPAPPQTLSPRARRTARAAVRVAPRSPAASLIVKTRRRRKGGAVRGKRGASQVAGGVQGVSSGKQGGMLSLSHSPKSP